MTLEEQIKQLTTELDEEKAIVDRVWAALGITTYEQAKPLAIDEHVKKLIAERDAAINRANIFEQSIKDAVPAYKRLLEERDAARADLKAIGECVGGDPLAVRGLVESMDAVIKERDAALKVKCFKCDDGHTPLYCLNCAREGYHHDDEWRPVVEALKTVTSQVCSSDPWRQKVAAETTGLEALAHAEKLTGKEKE